MLGTEIELVAVNDLVPADSLAYLVKYDSTQGRAKEEVFSKKWDRRRVLSDDPSAALMECRENPTRAHRKLRKLLHICTDDPSLCGPWFGA